MAAIEYNIKKAPVTEIFSFLSKTSKDFVPPLHTRLNLREYSEKIFNRAVTFEARNKGKMTGLIAAYFNDTEKENGFITSVGTLKAYSGMGIATELMSMCIDYARKTGFKKISLEVHKENKRAIKLYRKFGFLEKGKSDTHLTMSFDLI